MIKKLSEAEERKREKEKSSRATAREIVAELNCMSQSI